MILIIKHSENNINSMNRQDTVEHLCSYQQYVLPKRKGLQHCLQEQRVLRCKTAVTVVHNRSVYSGA